MIVKYFNDGSWGYIDNVQRIENRSVDTYSAVKEYDDCLRDGGIVEDFATVAGNEAYTASNKAFEMLSHSLKSVFPNAEWERSHTENHLDGHRVINNHPASAILVYLQDDKEFDVMAIITNQPCYLMNDKGQTIERLV